MSFTCSSQVLKPVIQKTDKDTLFCFTLGQSKLIAKELEKSAFCDTILLSQETALKILQELEAGKDSAFYVLKMKSSNQEEIIANRDFHIHKLNIELEKKDKQIKKVIRQKRLLGLGMFLVGIVAIVK